LPLAMEHIDVITRLQAVLRSQKCSSLEPMKPAQLSGESSELTQGRLRTRSGLVLPPLWVDFSCHAEASVRCPVADNIVACNQAFGESPLPRSDSDSLFQASTLGDNLSLNGIKCTVPPQRRTGHFSWYEWEGMFDDCSGSMDSSSRLRYPLRAGLPPTSERWQPRQPLMIVGRSREELNINPQSRSSGDCPFAGERRGNKELRIPTWSPLSTRPVTPKLATSTRSGRERRCSGGDNAVGVQRLPRPRRLEVIADDASRPASAAAALVSARSTRVIRRPHSTVVTAGMASGLEVNVWDWDVTSTPPHGSLIPDLPAEPEDPVESGWESRCFATSGLPAVPEEDFAASTRQLCMKGDGAQSPRRQRCVRELLQ